jgi:hypothetical protein
MKCPGCNREFGFYGHGCECIGFTPAPEGGYPDDVSGADWVLFCKRTNDPKLAWLQARLDEAGVVNRRNGESWHAPILEVPRGKLETAHIILDPIDDIPDDDPRFASGYAFDGGAE